jgi:hypothetical protein
MSRLPAPGQDPGVWGDILNDFLRVAHNDNGTIKLSVLASRTSNAILTTKGDMFVATAAETPDRVGVGADGLVLTVDSTQATGVKWAASPGIARVVASVSTATAAGSATSTDYVYLVGGSSTAITLPTAVGNANRYTITNVGSGTVMVATTSGQTINGSSIVTLPIQHMSLDFISDNANWAIQ